MQGHGRLVKDDLETELEAQSVSGDQRLGRRSSSHSGQKEKGVNQRAATMPR